MTAEVDDDPWFTAAWLSELALDRDRLEMSVETLAGLMAKYPTVELIHAHIDARAGLLPLWSDPFARSRAPAEVLEAVQHMAELNRWVILSVVLDPANALPTGARATAMLRSAFDPERAVFTFNRRSRASP